VESAKVPDDAPNDLKEAELEPIASLSPYAQIGKDEEASVLAIIFRVLKMIETADNTAGGAAGFAVLQQMQLLVRVW
jgi:hypothetical protein